MLLHPLGELSLWNVVSFDVVGHELLVRDGLLVTELLQLDGKLSVVQLHQSATLVGAFLSRGETVNKDVTADQTCCLPELLYQSGRYRDVEAEL